jgi:hypothetical protein
MIDDSKFFEAAQGLAQSLSQWDLLIIGGSLVIIVSTSYYRPASRRMRAAYLLFLPAWSCLAYSIYQGILVQRSYVAYLVAARNPANNQSTIVAIAKKMETATASQIDGLEYALVCLGAWLLAYIAWWVLAEQLGKEKS